jgi:hypothetical protein
VSDSANKQPPLFMVIYDDDQGLTAPMGKDRECEGALCGICRGDKIALFTSRKAARTAIEISAKFAALKRAQGKPENTDFLEGKAFLRVVECGL